MILCDSCSPRKQCTADKNRTECKYYQPQTNEEWFCGLSTEEKADFLHSIVIRSVRTTWDGKKPDYPAYLYDWKKWLKEKHNG